MGQRLDECRRQARASGRPLRIGVPEEYNVAELTPTVRRAWERTLRILAARDAEIVPVALPATRAALAAYYILAPAEASSNLARYDGLRYGLRAAADRSSGGGSSKADAEADAAGGTLFAPTRDAGFGPEVRRRILLGTYTLSAAAIGNYFVQAQRVRRLVQRDFDRVFAIPNCLVSGPVPDRADGQPDGQPDRQLEGQPDRQPERQADGWAGWRRDGVDAIVVPTALGPAPLLDAVQRMGQVERYAGDVLTVPASLAGLPAVSVPVAEGVGMQVIAQWGDERGLWCVARMVEEMGRRGQGFDDGVTWVGYDDDAVPARTA